MHAILKSAANGLALLLALPCYLAYRFGCLLLGPARAFPGWSQAFSLLPGLGGVYLRRTFYRMVFPGCAEDAFIGFGTLFSHPTARIGRRVYIGANCNLGDVTIEDDVLLSSNVSVINGGAQHGIERLDVPIREQPGRWPRVTIGRDSWIGDRSVVLADVGRQCVIGAGSVVVRPIPDYAVAIGSPARVLRFRNSPEARAGDGGPGTPMFSG